MKSLFWANGNGDVADFKTYKIHRCFFFWEEQTTNASGEVTLTNYKTNTPAYFQKADKSAAKIITGSTATLTTGWPSTEVLVRYQLLIPYEEAINVNEVALLPGDNDLSLSKGICANIQGNKKYMEG